MPRKKNVSTGKYHHGEMRKALTQAALEIVAASGVANLSLREIARRIGVSTAAPYFHFKDRQSLLIEIAIDGYSTLLGQLQAAQQVESSPQRQLERAVVTYLSFSRNHRAHYAIMFLGQFTGHERFDEMVGIANQCLELVRASIAQGIGSNQKEVAPAAFCAWSLLHGIAMLDQNGVLSESANEQESLGVGGVLSIVEGSSVFAKHRGRQQSYVRPHKAVRIFVR